MYEDAGKIWEVIRMIEQLKYIRQKYRQKQGEFE
jgi:hypothetical protein